MSFDSDFKNDKNISRSFQNLNESNREIVIDGIIWKKLEIGESSNRSSKQYSKISLVLLATQKEIWWQIEQAMSSKSL